MTAAGTSPEAAAKRLAKLLAETTRKRDCGPVERINERSVYEFRCPLSPDVRRSMARFEVVAAATYGSGAMVDYRTGGLPDGASMLMYVARNGEWAVSRFGLLYDPSAGTGDEDSRAGFGRTATDYLRAVREQDCGRFYELAVTTSGDEETACDRGFPRALADALAADPGAEARYLGGNERFGFYGLALTGPKPRYETISVIKLQPGTLQPYRVLDAVPGPLPRDSGGSGGGAGSEAGGRSGAARGASNEAPRGFIDDDTAPYMKPASAAPTVHIPSGAPPKRLKIRDLREGTGKTVARGDEAIVNYVGHIYSTKRRYDTSYGRNPVPMRVVPGRGDFIEGFEEGIVGMSVGGRRQITIPPGEAYGDRGFQHDVRPGDTLVFVADVEQVHKRGRAN